MHLFRITLVFAVGVLAFGVSPAEEHGLARDACGPGIFVPAVQTKERVQAWFAARSYSPGTTAALWVRAPASTATLRLYQVAGIQWWSEIAPAARVRLPGGRRRVAVEIGDWPSGLYFAEVSSRDGNGSAPFIVRARHPGENRVAVVIPTNTWAAYNLRDGDGDGYGDTWYADPSVHTVALGRPFLRAGVPRQLGGFPGWLAGRGLSADFYSDEDLNRVPSGDRLAALHDLVLFSGHEEYVTAHVFSILERYRDLGGNLAFLSANDFFSRVRLSNGRMTCFGHFRDFGRPEASLVGVQYVDWYRRRYRSRPYVVRSPSATPWLFYGTGLRAGNTFGFSYGVEIDALAPSSPQGIRVIADIPSIFGRGRTAQMTYYSTKAGAKVFAAGAMGFDTPQSGATDQMLRNLWDYLSQP